MPGVVQGGGGEWNFKLNIRGGGGVQDIAGAKSEAHGHSRSIINHFTYDGHVIIPLGEGCPDTQSRRHHMRLRST